MTRMLSLVVLVAVIVVTGVMFYRVMIGFLLPLFLAAVLVVMFRPVHLRLLDHWPGRNRIAALCTTLLVILVVMLPTGLITTLAVKEASDGIADLDTAELRQRISRLPTTLRLQLPFADATRYIESALGQLSMRGCPNRADLAGSRLGRTAGRHVGIGGRSRKGGAGRQIAKSPAIHAGVRGGETSHSGELIL